MNATAQHEVDTFDPEELRDAAKRLLADQVKRRAGWEVDGVLDTRALEAEIASLGWPLLTIPTPYGGLGQNFLALVPIYEETGRSLSPVTIADTMTAVDVLIAANGATAQDLLERIVAAGARVAVGFVPSLDAGSLTLCLRTVRGATGATDLMLLPRSGGNRVVLVDLRGAGVEVAPVSTWDRGRLFSDITLNGAEARPVAIDVQEAAQIAHAHADLAMAWESIGAAEQSLTEAVAYMCTRQQFGRPVGSFQALKHRAADLKVGLELARALSRRASELYAERALGWSDFAGQARLLAVDAFRAIAEEAVQFHGGIGFTWEHDCHLFLKRALMNEMLGETPEQVRDRIASGILTRALARGA